MDRRTACGGTVWFVGLVLLGCTSTSHADKLNDAARLAATDLAAVVAHEHLDGAWRS